MPAVRAPRSLGIVFVHGGFHKSSCFDLAKAQLEAAGFSPIIGVDLPSGYSVAERAAQSKKGGIRTIVYVTANMPPTKGASALSVLPPGLDIIDVADGLVTANSKAKAAFYGPDMPDELAAALPQVQSSQFCPPYLSTW
ncbi:hypothetical protein CcaCcLH18_14134 [Colletotrichum camelliae]|nr:hypothetical protein CcaCcLH18_14134 [Colletotrichum camelliae]